MHINYSRPRSVALHFQIFSSIDFFFDFFYIATSCMWRNSEPWANREKNWKSRVVLTGEHMIDFLYTSREKNFETSYVIETSNIV